MMTTFVTRTRWALASVALVVGAGANAQLPELQQSGNIEYLNGGISLDESQAIQAASHGWPLTLEFSVARSGRAQYASDVVVDVRNAAGNSIFKDATAGPFLLLRLPPGTYSVSATLSGHTLSRKVTVSGNGKARASFVWPKNIDS